MKKIVTILLFSCLFVSMSMAQDYVGPEKCLTCHNNPGLHDMTGWRSSMHANGYSVVFDDSRTMENKYGVVNDYDQNGIDDFHDGLDFNTISSVFDPMKPNAPVLAYSAEKGYTITMGEVTSQVHLTYGGSGLYKQRYALKVPTADGLSADLYISPIQYNEKTHEYVLYHADAWYKYVDGAPTNEVIYTPSSTLDDIAGNSRSLTKGCAGCHVTGLSVNAQTEHGEWTTTGGAIDPSTIDLYKDNNIYDFNGDGVMEQANVGCERCHGPGAEHAKTADKTKIINPKDLTAEQENSICGMCHSRGKSLPNNTFSFPYDDENMHSWMVGDLVKDYYTDGGGYYGDKVSGAPFTSKQHHQQFLDFYRSGKPTFEPHMVRCSECHDVHNEVKHHIRQEIVEEGADGAEVVIATDNDNNSLCLACHATHGDFEGITKEMVADLANNTAAIGEIVSKHTNHPYDPENGPSRCSKCHNPKSAKSAVAYDIHSHTFEPIPPQKTIEFAMPNSCSVSCHRGFENSDNPIFNTGKDESLTDWTEDADIALANKLMEYYGPDGKWWNHVVSVEKTDDMIPADYEISQNYPNPFNPTTNINFTVPQASDVSIVVYNALGQQVAQLVNDFVPAGSYKITWNAASQSSGVYFYRIESGNFVQTMKMVLMK